MEEGALEEEVTGLAEVSVRRERRRRVVVVVVEVV